MNAIHRVWLLYQVVTYQVVAYQVVTYQVVAYRLLLITDYLRRRNVPDADIAQLHTFLYGY